MADTNPIIVNGAVLPTALASALRYGVTMLGTFAVGHGWVKADNLEGVMTVALTLATVAYGLWKSYSNKSKLVTAAEAAPNSVAKVV